MLRKPVRNYYGKNSNSTRVFDIIIDEDSIFLEVKTDKQKYERIPWEYVVKQVESIIE